MAQRVGEGLWLFLAKILSTAVVLVNKVRTRWSQSSVGENENENEYALSWTLAAQPNNGHPWPTLLQAGTALNSNHRGHYFYSSSGRQIPGVVFSNVNIFNFSHEAFSPNFIFAPVITILLAFLQIRSSTASVSPFHLHPVIFMASVICSIVYCFSFAAKFVFPGFASLFEVVMSISGFLVVASLTPLVLQLPWWSIFFILLFLVGFFKLLKKLHGIYGNLHHPRPRAVQLPLLPIFNH